MPNFSLTQLGREARGWLCRPKRHTLRRRIRQKKILCLCPGSDYGGGERGGGEIHIIVYSATGVDCVSVEESLSGFHVKGTVGQVQCV